MCVCVCVCVCQASQLIVSYDEHEVNDTYKFGVIYQKLGQVSGCHSICAVVLVFGCLVLQPSVSLSLSLSVCPSMAGVGGGVVWEHGRDASLCRVSECAGRHGGAAGL